MRELLAELERDVELALVLGPEEEPLPGARDIDFSRQARRLLEGLVSLAERLSLTVVEGGEPRFPAIRVLPEGADVGIRYYGLPWGYELGSLVGACLDAGHRDPSLSPASLDALRAVERDVAIDVFVTPT